MAIQEWAKVRNLADVSLERAIGAFDSFIVQDRSGDFNEVRNTSVGGQNYLRNLDIRTTRRYRTFHTTEESQAR